MKKYKHISFEERFVIEKLFLARVRLREISRFLLRSPNTISREIKKNVISGVYQATHANHRAYVRRWRAKRQCLKVAMDQFLCRFVEKKLREKWSPEQISGYLKREMDIRCSAKCIYKFANKRSLNHLLFWGWNNVRGGRKRSAYKTTHDNRKYIEERLVAQGIGHVELDFIVSKESAWCFLVAIDRVTKYTCIHKLPNRKRHTIRAAFSEMFRGIPIKSITTDNDIAFQHWPELEKIIQAPIYFCHPYHSWEKGLVENTNRWIRCFVPKRRDIRTVTQEELDEIHAFLNNRPREIIGFRTPSEYYYKLTSVLLEG